MRTITNELINEIRNKTDIVNVISNYLPLTKRGKNYFGVCPFHDDHSPSMSVSSEKQIYTCFSCGASGNVFTFVSEYEHISFIEAVKLLGEKLGLSLSNVKEEHIDPKYANYYKIYDLASKFYQNNINTALGREAYAYLEKRHFDKDTIKKFGIGLSSKNTPLTTLLLKSGYDKETLITLGLTNDGENDLFINRIMFPLFDLNGQVVGFSGRIYLTKDSSKYVNSKESPIFKKGELLYNYHNVKEHLKKSDTLIIMEGFMDVIRASTIGIDNCVASMGTAVTKNQALLLKKSANNIVLCFDGDSAGEDATISCAELLLKNGVTPKVVRLEEELDPDEYILKYGEEAFKQKINNPISLLEFKMNLLKKDHKFNDLKDISNYVNEVIKNLNVLNVYSDLLSMCIDQEMIEEKTNEITAIPDVIKRLNVKNVICTWDALNTQKNTVEAVIQGKGDYVGALKGNQGSFYQDVIDYFDEDKLMIIQSGYEGAYKEELEKSHSQVIKYEYYQTEDIKWYEDVKSWKGLKSIGLVVKTMENKKGEKVVEKRYYISSLLIDIYNFSKAIRNHWNVENKLHWQLDFTFKSDDNTTVNKKALFNLQIIKKFALNILNQVKEDYKCSLKKIRFQISLNAPEELERIFKLMDKKIEN